MDNIQVKKKGRKPRNTEAFDKISNVAVGEFIIITEEEWKIKPIPGAHVIRRYTDLEFKVETLADDSGWKLTRVE
ncbi:MAG: hypothetical protein V3V41_02000 [Candidatus Heimdallarchaeota archaeon]